VNFYGLFGLSNVLSTGLDHEWSSKVHMKNSIGTKHIVVVYSFANLSAMNGFQGLGDLAADGRAEGGCHTFNFRT
jgi:hypothetical protein